MDSFVQQKPDRTVLAILTHADNKRIFRGNQENFIDLIRAGKEKDVLVYVMTTSDFKLTEKHAVGYTYHFGSKTWKKALMPLPQVVYNRIPFRKFEIMPEVQQVIKTCLRHPRIRFFNPAFFNKWTLFEWLNQSKATRPFIPVTHRLTAQTELEQLLKKHDCLYLKPIRGKAGKGIMKVNRSSGLAGGSGYELSVQEKTGSHVTRFPSVHHLWSQIRSIVDSKDYIMQQAITLAHYKQRPFDLRVLVQKDGKGSWTIAGVGARLAGKLSITTHVPRGGSIEGPSKLLAATFGTTGSRRIVQRAKKAALTIAKQIESSSDQLLGEMSMDLGVDSAGRIWFFEANSKPMKFDEPHIRKKSLENLILFSIYLSKLKPASREEAHTSGYAGRSKKVASKKRKVSR